MRRRVGKIAGTGLSAWARRICDFAHASRPSIAPCPPYKASPGPSLPVEPDAGKVLVEVVAGGDFPPLEVRAMRNDPVPPQRDEVVRLVVEHPLLVGAHDPLLLGDVAGAIHGVVELLELLVLEAAILVARHV